MTEKIVDEIRDQGFSIVEDVYSPDECNRYIAALEKQLTDRLQSGSYCGNETNQVLDNYFMNDPALVGLIHQDITDAVMRELIDDDYVLISPSARNRRLLADQEFGRRTSGIGWHTDSRFIGKQGIRPSLSYIAIVCLDAFGEDNGATHTIPNSHKRYQRPPDRDAELDYISLLVPKGGVAIIDTALWHKVGAASENSRWGIFNTYGPWFMKPYHRFNEMFSQSQAKKLSPICRQLLHFDSIPPKDHDESMITLARVRAMVEGQ